MINYNKMKIKTIIYLFALLLIINAVTYVVSERNLKNIINIVMADNIKTIKNNYEILLHTQKITASTAYKSTIQIPKVIQIIKEANTASDKQKAKLRKELHKILKNKYALLKEKGVLQYQFVLKNNESFYRAHKLSKNGDDLTNI